MQVFDMDNSFCEFLLYIALYIFGLWHMLQKTSNCMVVIPSSSYLETSKILFKLSGSHTDCYKELMFCYWHLHTMLFYMFENKLSLL